MQKLSVVIPVLNDAGMLGCLLHNLQDAIDAGVEVIVIDGGSDDNSLAVARNTRGVRAESCDSGRAVQLNHGISCAGGEVIWMLHADTRLDTLSLGFCHAILSSAIPVTWGRFDVRFDAPDAFYRLLANAMNIRSRMTHVATGDQGIFVSRALLQQIGGVPDIALMEDVALSKCLRQITPCQSLQKKLTISARRWQKKGVIKTVLLMWSLRLAFVLGISPAVLRRWYYGAA